MSSRRISEGPQTTVAAGPAATVPAGAALRETLESPAGGSSGFGSAVALGGGLLLVGAEGDDSEGINVGRAHLFDAATGAPVRTLDDPTPSQFDRFGVAVALDAGRALVGASSHVEQGARIGQAHLFDAATGTLLLTLDDPTPTTLDQFGVAVAFSGERLVVGAPGDDGAGTDIGQVHVFDAASGALVRTLDDPTPTARDDFGAALAIEGDRLLVGAPGDDTSGGGVGEAHLFDLTTGALLRTLDAPGLGASAAFGSAVALSGARALVGARFDDADGTDVGSAHLFDTATGALIANFADPTVTDADSFGWAVALDGDRALIGARSDATAGARVGEAHLFDAASGDLLATIADPTPSTEDQFGTSLALDGDLAAIGAPLDDGAGMNAGQVSLFDVAADLAPTAVNDRAVTAPGTPVLIDATANDSDPEGGALIPVAAGAAAGAAPANGAVAIVGTALDYTPDPGFAGIDRFDYRVADPAGGTATATVAVRVGAPEQRPNVSRGTADDDALLIAQSATYVGFEGADLFLLSVAARSDALSVIEGRQGDVLQVTQGLEIAGFDLRADALLLDLPNGAQLRVLQADAMAFDIGGNVTTGDAGTRADFGTFARSVLGVDLPAAGDAVTGGPFTIDEALLM